MFPKPFEGPEELAVREAANRRLEAVLREAFLWRKKVMFLHPRIYDVSLTFRLGFFAAIFGEMSCFPAMSTQFDAEISWRNCGVCWTLIFMWIF